MNLGKDGIFICDDCRTKLKIEIPQETFNKVKEAINAKEIKDVKCYLCNGWKTSDQGLDLPANTMADALQANLDKTQELHEFYEDGFLICPNCGNKVEYEGDSGVCKCGLFIDAKDYGKKIKMPIATKITLRMYIKYLRGKSSVPGAPK